MPPAPPSPPPVGADGHCLVEADADGRITWLLPVGTPDSHVRRLLTAGVAVVRSCGFAAPPGGIRVGTWPPDVLHLPFVEDPGDSVAGVDPGWREEVCEDFVAEGAPRPAVGDVIAVLEADTEGPFPGPIEVLHAAGTTGLLVFRGAVDCPDDGLSVRFSISEGIGVLILQAPLGAPPQVLAEAGQRMVNSMAEFAPGAFAPWPPRSADAPGLGLQGDRTTGPTMFACFHTPDPERAMFAFNSVCAAGDGPLPPLPEAPS